MQVQWIRDTDGFRRLAAEWDDLLADAGCNHPFLTWTWTYHWWRHYAEDHRLAIVAVRDGGQLIGLAPLCVGAEPDRFGTRVLRFLGTGEVCSEYLGFILRHGRELDAAGAIVDFLMTEAAGAWDLLELTEMCASSLMTAAVEQALIDRELTYYRGPGWRYHRVRLPETWDGYLKGVTSSRRGRVRRMIRRLEKQGGRLEPIERPEQLPEAWDHLVRLHQMRWNSQGEPGCFVSRRFSRFHRSLLEPMLAQGRLALSILYADGDAIAANYAYRSGEHLYCYQSGLNPEWGKYNPGHALTAFNIRETIGRGVRIYDLLGGTPEAKDRWVNEQLSTSRFLVAAPRTTARAHFARRMAVHHVKEGLKQHSPRWLLGALRQARAKLPGLPA